MEALRQSGMMLLLLVAFCGFAAGGLVGNNKCTWGPSYWCQNITSGAHCGAVSYCVEKVWVGMEVPKDDDEVCKICLDMVKEARDQLESNQTQEDLKAVLEGSCMLLPINVLREECKKFVNAFIPELIETLSSEMSPDVVCTVAGLCNNAKIDDMLAEQEASHNSLLRNVQLCQSCNIVIEKMRERFDETPYEKFLEHMLRMCGKLGSFSDSCSTIVFTRFEDIYSHLQNYFRSEEVCHVAGTCTYKFHQHESDEKPQTNIEITPMGRVGRLDVESDDLPCEFCERLVDHMRDVIIANTTEEEFKRVLTGICKQTGSFKDECLSIVDQYYDMIYVFLVKEMNSTAVCYMAGMCPKGSKIQEGPIAPLVPLHAAEIAVRVIAKKPDEKLIGIDEKNSYLNQKSDNVHNSEKSQNVQIMHPELSQLPIERMFVPLPQSKEACVFCQYFLHYIQEQISDDKNEEKIKAEVEKACKMLPNSIEGQCETFVEAYGNAFIALLTQEIDPSVICTKLALCPEENIFPQINVLMTVGSGDKPNCPLCLFAVQQLESMLKKNRTEENIRNALDNLCSHLTAKLKPECVDFVDTYSKQLIEMMAAEFTPQEVCVFLKLCEDKRPDNSMVEYPTTLIDMFHSNKNLMADRNRFKKPFLPESMLSNMEDERIKQIETNIIADNTYGGKTLIYANVSPQTEVKASPQCIICEFIMSQIDNQLKDNATEEEVKKIVHSVCNHMPKTVKADCNKFVDEYADEVIKLLVAELNPDEVCGQLKMCTGKSEADLGSIVECVVCHELVDIVEKILRNPNVDHKIGHVIEKSCNALPMKYINKCHDFMNKYGEKFLYLVMHLADSRMVCHEILLCSVGEGTYVNMHSGDESRHTRNVGKGKCSYGPSYWCANEDNAKECKALDHCQQHYWKDEKSN